MSNDEIQALIDTFGEGNVTAAFWLQQHIKKHGLDGIGYMKYARGNANSQKYTTTKSSIEGKMEQQY